MYTSKLVGSVCMYLLFIFVPRLYVKKAIFAKKKPLKYVSFPHFFYFIENYFFNMMALLL